MVSGNACLSDPMKAERRLGVVDHILRSASWLIVGSKELNWLVTYEITLSLNVDSSLAKSLS